MPLEMGYGVLMKALPYEWYVGVSAGVPTGGPDRVRSGDPRRAVAPLKSCIRHFGSMR